MKKEKYIAQHWQSKPKCYGGNSKHRDKFKTKEPNLLGPN